MAVAKHKTKTSLEETLAKVAQLDRLGYLQVDISKQIGVSQPAISMYLKKIRVRYQQAQLGEMNELIQEKLAQLRDLRSEAHQAWLRSQEGDDGEKRTGDAVFLRVMLDTIEAEREMLGINAPKELNLNGTLDVFDWSKAKERPLIADPLAAKVQQLEMKKAEGEGEPGWYADFKPTQKNGKPASP